MDHLVQFTISVDDENIVSRIEESAEKQIIEGLRQQVIGKLWDKRFYGQTKIDPASDPLNEFAKQIVVDIVSDYKDDIIRCAADTLADRLGKTKKVKAILNAMLEDENSEEKNNDN